MKLILDPGSTHGGSFQKARELVHLAAEVKADGIKFQLLTEPQLKGGNIELSWDMCPYLIEHGLQRGVEVFFSVFDEAGLKRVQEWGCKSVKFSYSMAEKSLEWDVSFFETVYVSCDIMNEHKFTSQRKLVKLYCVPEYPVRYNIDFEGLFHRFQGFSDHTLGIQQSLEAKRFGCGVLEKHFCLDEVVDCPDYRFSLKPKQLRELAKVLRRNQTQII